MRKPCGASVRRLAIMVLAVLLAVGFGGAAGGHVQAIARSGGFEFVRALDPSAPAAGVYFAQGKGRSRPNFDSFPPEERPRMQQQFREWQSLPPDQKDAMRRRMDEWNRMPPNERNRYQQRYQQWQQLSPSERRQLENNLQRWDNLSPQDRDSIRQRFRP